MKITVEMLKQKNACRQAIEWFEKTFPQGGSEAEVIARCPQGDWLLWGLWNLELATIEQIIMGGVAAGRLSLQYADKESKPVLEAAFDAADAVADNNNTETRRAAESAARSAAESAAESAANAAWSAAWSAAESAARSAARSAANAARSAAESAAWSAENAARSAANAAWIAASAENTMHLKTADAIRALMKTNRWKKAGRTVKQGE